MTGKNVWVVRFLLTAIMAVGLAVSGCGNDGQNGQDGQDGMDGMDGQDGEQGPPGGPAPGPGDVIDITDPFFFELLVELGEPLVAEITDAAAASEPVVDFTLKTAGGADVTGLPVDTISFTFVRLVPEVVETSPPRTFPSHWESYINTNEVPRTMPPLTSPDLLDTAQQTSSDSAGTLVDNGDGSYRYTFATDVTIVDASLTHRTGFEIRIDDAINPDNPTFTFVPDGSP